MKITIIDHFRGGEPVVIEGTPLSVEEDLRRHYRGVLNHIEMGDLADCIQTLQRMTGVRVMTEGWFPPPPKVLNRPHRHKQHYDIWAREDD